MSRRGRFRWDVFLVAALVATGLHLYVLIPRLLMPLLERREEPVEVAYLDDTSPPSPTSPNEQPPGTPTEVKPPEPEPASQTERKPEPPTPEPPKPAPPPEVATVEPPKPEPEKKPEAKPPEPPPPPVNARMKMVDQDRANDEPDNPDAKYLAQKNHRTVEDTRSLDTNLVRETRSSEEASQPSSPSDNQLPNPGEKEQKIAELEDRKGREHEIVRSKPLQGDRGEAKKAPKPGKLAMRDLTPRATEPVPETKRRDGVELQEEGPGPLPQGRVGSDGERAQAGRKGVPGKPKLRLDSRDYDAIEGEAVAEKERRDAARAERSHAEGRWDKVGKKLAMMRSSLENFTPEVRPGNQSELGTRRHPFAAYIAEMHRSIHKLWAFGFLSDLDGKGATNPYNDMDLWTQLEIVLKPDGTVEKITIVRPSGNGPFDVAAMDAVMSSAPFSPPPEAIKSANGKVYLDWRFHRDDRQCGTFGVDPHILTTVAENKQHDVSEIAKDPRVAPPRVLKRPTEPSSTTTVVVPSGGAPETGGVPDGAKDAAEGWFAAYVRGDAGWLSGWSASPFSTAGHVVARDGATVKQLYAALLKEAPADRRLDKFAVYTAGGIRAKLGGLPPGGEGDGSMMFAVGEVGKEQFVLLLKKSDQGWRVCGIDR